MQAIITNGLYRKTELNGMYECIKHAWNDSGAEPKNARMKIVIDGAHRVIRVNKEDIQYVEDDKVVEQTAPPETEDEIEQRISNAFEAMDIFAQGAINGHIRALIISGAAGVGKTFTLEKELVAAETKGKIIYNKVAGICSAVGLYQKMWECRGKKAVLLLDDVDVYKDEDQMNLLKAALDTGEDRWVSYAKASAWLADQDIPNEFLFEGTIIFISNKDFDRELQANTKLSPHYDALISRSIYLDLGVHTKEEILIRVKQVVNTTSMLQQIGLTDDQIDEMLIWVEINVEKIRALSLRTCLHIADIMLSSPDKWEMLSGIAMLSKKRK